MGALLATLVLAMEIHASGACPSSAQVQRQLGPLLGDAAAAGASDVATIKHERDGSVSVSLADAEGRAIGDRRLPRARSCDDQAETVGVTLAIWEAQLHPEISLRLDRLSRETPPPPAAAPAPEATLVRPAVPLPARPRSLAHALGFAAVGDARASDWSPGARAELRFGPAGARWRLGVGGVAVGRHAVAVPPGQASWWRAFLILGAELDVARSDHWAAVLGAGAAGGIVSIAGSGFDVDRSSRSLDLGGEVSARAEWRPGRLHPWLGASVVTWARRQAVDLQGVSTGSALPRVEPMLAGGADFVW